MSKKMVKKMDFCRDHLLLIPCIKCQQELKKSELKLQAYERQRLSRKIQRQIQIRQTQQTKRLEQRKNNLMILGVVILVLFVIFTIQEGYKLKIGKFLQKGFLLLIIIFVIIIAINCIICLNQIIDIFWPIFILMFTEVYLITIVYNLYYGGYHQSMLTIQSPLYISLHMQNRIMLWVMCLALLYGNTRLAIYLAKKRLKQRKWI